MAGTPNALSSITSQMPLHISPPYRRPPSNPWDPLLTFHKKSPYLPIHPKFELLECNPCMFSSAVSFYIYWTASLVIFCNPHFFWKISSVPENLPIFHGNNINCCIEMIFVFSWIFFLHGKICIAAWKQHLSVSRAMLPTFIEELNDNPEIEMKKHAIATKTTLQELLQQTVCNSHHTVCRRGLTVSCGILNKAIVYWQKGWKGHYEATQDHANARPRKRKSSAPWLPSYFL